MDNLPSNQSQSLSKSFGAKLSLIASAFLLSTGCKPKATLDPNQKLFEQNLAKISGLMNVREHYFNNSDCTVVIFSSIHKSEVEKKIAESVLRLNEVFKLDIIGLEGNSYTTQHPFDKEVLAEYKKIFAVADAIPNTLKIGSLVQVYTPIDTSGFSLNKHIEESRLECTVTGLETLDKKKALKQQVIGIVIHSLDFIEEEIATKGHCVMSVGGKSTKHSVYLTTALDWLGANYPEIPLPKSITTAAAKLNGNQTEMAVIEKSLFKDLAEWYKKFRDVVSPEILEERNQNSIDRLSQLRTETGFKNAAIIFGARHTLKYSADDMKPLQEFMLEQEMNVIIVDPPELAIKIKSN